MYYHHRTETTRRMIIFQDRDCLRDLPADSRINVDVARLLSLFAAPSITKSPIAVILPSEAISDGFTGAGAWTVGLGALITGSLG